MTDTPQAPLDLDQFEGHTPGPWEVDDHAGWLLYRRTDVRGHKTAAPVLLIPSGYYHCNPSPPDGLLLKAAPRLLAEVRELRAKLAEANARAKVAERQRDELLDAILDQAQRCIASIPHDIWATAVRISKERNAQKEINPNA